ncbi:MAG: RecX family transcriptional regulator [Rhodospirillales bacterium]|nr:MAG: RecX family transcriptional regulator [Rhodospirillales bacterium]
MKPPLKASPKSLENAALHYLGRFSTSKANLKRVLLNRVARSAKAHGTDPQEGLAWIEALMDKLEGLGYLNDAAYAESKAESMNRRGKPSNQVRWALKMKGVDQDTTEAALSKLTDEVGEPDRAAALAFARKKRLGPYRPEDLRETHKTKDIQALARAGFGWDLAREIVEAGED